MESHKGILQGVVELPFDFLAEQVGGHGVVNIQQGYRAPGNASSNIFAECAVNIHLTGNGNPFRCETAVYIAGLKAKFFRESRPALIGKYHILTGAPILLRPIQQCELKLRHTRQ